MRSFLPRLFWILPWFFIGFLTLAIAQQVAPPVGPPSGIACAYNSSPPPVNSGFAAWVQCDSKGRLITNNVTSGSGAYTGVTVGTADSTILTASTAQYFLDLVNNSATATICINFGTTATILGSACSAGEITIPPLWHRSWEQNFIPTDAIHAIASGASTPATVGWW